MEVSAEGLFLVGGAAVLQCAEGNRTPAPGGILPKVENAIVAYRKVQPERGEFDETAAAPARGLKDEFMGCVALSALG